MGQCVGASIQRLERDGEIDVGVGKVCVEFRRAREQRHRAGVFAPVEVDAPEVVRCLGLGRIELHRTDEQRFGFRTIVELETQHSEIGHRASEGWIEPQGATVCSLGALPRRVLVIEATAVEIVIVRGSCMAGRAPSGQSANDVISQGANVEVQEQLSRRGIERAERIADDDAGAVGEYPQIGQRRRRRQRSAHGVECAADACHGNSPRDEVSRGANHDEVLKCISAIAAILGARTCEAGAFPRGDARER